MISLTYYLAIVALAALTLYVILYNWRRRHLYWAASKINGPPALPILGNSTLFMCKNEDMLMKIYNLTRDSNLEPMKLWLGPMLLLFFLKPDHVEKILSSSKLAHKHTLYDFVKTYLGEGLVSASEIIMGSDERSQLNGLNDFDHAMLNGYNLVFTRMINPYLHPDIIFNMTPYKKLQDEYQTIIRGKAEFFIQDSVKRTKQPKSPKEFYPIIDTIMDYTENNPEAISDENVKDHILTLFAASEDTFTIISGFLTMCFGMYPEYQEKAAREIREIFGDTPRPVTEDDIRKLNYVTMCIKDVLRLFPIAPVILRNCTGDFQLDKWDIPKGCAVVIPIFTIHRDGRFWENPDHFHPDHFLPETENKRHVFAYVPFSAGPRGCIGKILAHTGLKVFICNLLQRFEIEADGKLPDVELMMDISTRPKRGYFVRLKKRVWK